MVPDRKHDRFYEWYACRQVLLARSPADLAVAAQVIRGAGYPYDDSLPGFAPDVSIMLANFGNSWTEAGTAYCGLEAEFTTPDGRMALLYIADGFDPQWVREPGSIERRL